MKPSLFLMLTFVTIFTITFSVSAMVQESLTASISTIKTNQQSSKPQRRVKTAKQAAQIAQSRFGGKVLKVQVQKSAFRVKLIKKDGHIISVVVDAKSGRISGR